ncbi:MAG: tRNA (adenosine(37)-N6)-threonylcarbamoyltransferase complex transferase subunit TsaD [Pseudomonadota bacterium]
MTVLGIETSCDETAAAVVRAHADGRREVLSNLVLSQIAEHAPYGGVVPEIAARAHILGLDRLIAAAIAEAGCGWEGVSGVAATAGPGLIGGVMVGLVTGKAVAAARQIPLVAVNHLEGHALSVRLTEKTEFPYLLLLASGGHCQILEVQGVGRYLRLGGTLDDALGEAFDKTAKLLGLGYPGGPAVEQAAKGGDAARFPLPRPMLGREGCDFSFSGLKTAVRHAIARHGPMDAQACADMAAGFQAACLDIVRDRAGNALALFTQRHATGPHRVLAAAGGVAANRALRAALGLLCEEWNFRLVTPPAPLCTDNAAMIAWAGIERLRLGQSDPLDTPARARWPLAAGSGGIKAIALKDLYI